MDRRKVTFFGNISFSRFGDTLGMKLGSELIGEGLDWSNHLCRGVIIRIKFTNKSNHFSGEGIGRIHVCILRSLSPGRVAECLSDND